MTKWGFILVTIGMGIVFWPALFSSPIVGPAWDLSEFPSWEETLRMLGAAVFILVGAVFIVRGLLSMRRNTS